MTMCGALATLGMLSVAALSAQQPVQPNPVTQRAFQHLQGTWRFESMEQDGTKVPADELKGRTLFIGGELFLIRDGDKVLSGGRLSLDPNRSPATFDVTGGQGPKTETLLRGIYRVGGDALTLAFAGRDEDRPREFASAAGSKVRLVVAQRDRPKDEAIDIVGTYTAESIGTDGKNQQSVARIERRGDAYVVTFQQGNAVIYVGVAVRQGDTLSLAWGRQNQVGVCQYKIEKGPRLVGRYTNLGGPGVVLPETLTKLIVNE